MAGGKIRVKMMVPKRLKEARERAGLSQEKFAQLAGLSNKSLISNYESGRRVASFIFIARLASALDYPEAYFYTIDDGFAEVILQMHRNRNNPDFNPYYKSQLEILESISALKDKLEKSLSKKSK